jgi:chaperonin GroES
MAYDETTPRSLELESMSNDTNVAEELKEEELNKIADVVLRSIKDDEQTMGEWRRRYSEYLDLAMQIKGNKSFPWRNAANVKYPLLTIASLQFHARAYPAIVNAKGLVKGKVVGYDPTGDKAKRAERVGKHMTYTLLEKMPDWDEGMDKLLLTLPIAGCMFKKVFYDGFEQEICSELIFPTDIIINYWAKNMASARRITHKIAMYENEIVERQRDGYYLDIELSPPAARGKTKEEDKRSGQTAHVNGEDDATPYEILECHTYYDLDEDGYKEPYVITLERQNAKILRIAPNFDIGSIRKNAKNEIVRIKAKQTFVKYDFIPAPDGGLLGVGFGLLLGSLNETVNTSINQLVDQGTMYTTGGGFIAKGIRLKGGRLEFEPNEWKVVQTTGDDLRKGVFPLPVKEPSKILFDMLQALVASGKEIIAISEIATGKLPGQNTPATTTLTSVEEGMKLFTAIYKRIHRSLKAEFKRVFELNSVYLDEEEYFQVLDAQGNPIDEHQVSRADYNLEDCDVVPESDPNAASDALRLLKAEQLVQLIPLGAVDPAKAGQRILAALDVPKPDELMPNPQNDPKMIESQQKMQMEQQKGQMEMILKQQEMQFKEKEAQMKLQMKMMELRLKEVEMTLDIKMKGAQHQMDMQAAQEDHIMQREMNAQNMEMQKLQGNQKLELGQKQHEQKLKQVAESNKAGGNRGVEKPSSNKGVGGGGKK